MIRQSFVEERISDLHHHALQSSGGGDGDMSKATARRIPAPAASRMVIKKNPALVPKGTEVTADASSPTTSSPAPAVDPRSRIELLERNLHYVQQQHELTLADLHSEISKLQHENRDLHFRMANIRLPSASASRQRKAEVLPSIPQLADLTQNEPVIEKRLQEVQRVHFEQQVSELRTRLIESEQRNEYLTRSIEGVNQARSLQTPQRISSGVPVLLPDPYVSTNANTTDSVHTKPSKSEEPQMNQSDYERLLAMSYEKQRQQIQEIARLRAVLREILQAERLSSTSKILVRDCLAATHSSESSTAAATEVSHVSGSQQAQQPNITSSSTSDKATTSRHELPVRRLNLSPPPFVTPRSNGHRRLSEQRFILPPIGSDKTGASDVSDNSLNPGLQQQFFKFGETPIARRGRRTQELQRTRLTRNLYH